MSVADRIAIEPCGCHTDKPTGITTNFCPKHQPCSECGKPGLERTNARGAWVCAACADWHEKKGA